MGLLSTATPTYDLGDGNSVDANQIPGLIHLNDAQEAAILALTTGITDKGKTVLLKKGGFTAAEAVSAYDAGDVDGWVLAFVGVLVPDAKPTKKHIVSSPAWAVNPTTVADDLLITAGASFTVHVPKGKKVRVKTYDPRWTSTTLAANPWPSVRVVCAVSAVTVNSDDSEEWTYTTSWQRTTGGIIGATVTAYTAAAAGAYDVTVESEIY